MLIAAPAGITTPTIREDSPRRVFDSVIRNKPLLLYFVAYGVVGLAAGMWYGLLYFYLDSYLGLGTKVPLMFLMATVLGALSTPLWVKLIHKTSKSTAWALGISLFIAQSVAALWITPASSAWPAFGIVILANLFFACHDVAAVSILGDIIDYGKLKFRKDRGATYFGFNALLFKIGLGVGGGLALGLAGLLGFEPAGTSHSETSILGLKFGFIALPILFAAIGLLFAISTPIDQRRHRIIQRRIESRSIRTIR